MISVIIPVYKVENYIQQCVDSVVSQSYDNLEIILVDDGSPDRSGKICDEYAEKDLRVKSYHIPNGGVSNARNYGLDRADGDYIFFLDSDDFIEPDCLAVLLAFQYAEKTDCTVCAARTIHDEVIKNLTTAEINPQKRIVTKESAITSLCYMQKPYPGIDMGAIWGCLFKRSVIGNNRFDDRISIGEDFEYNFRVLQNARKVAYISTRLYNYRIISSSIMRNGFDQKKYESVIRLAEIADCQQKYQADFLSRTVNIALVVYLTIPEKKGACKEYRCKIEEYICSKRNIVLRNRKCRNKVRIALMLSYFGFSFMRAVFMIAKKESK